METQFESIARCVKFVGLRIASAVSINSVRHSESQRYLVNRDYKRLWNGNNLKAYFLELQLNTGSQDILHTMISYVELLYTRVSAQVSAGQEWARDCLHATTCQDNLSSYHFPTKSPVAATSLLLLQCCTQCTASAEEFEGKANNMPDGISSC